MLAECRAGNLNLIITKSISRFARNTVTLLETVRELKDLGVDVYFEEQNIHSLSSDGELMLSILASYAQEESLSASENQKWRIRKDFEQGKVSSLQMLGYKRNHDGVLEIITDEAEIVRLIFNSYLSGMGKLAIANMLNEMHISTKFDNEWTAEAVRRILTNEKYCGELMLQKFYSENHLTKRKMINHGEIKKFYVEEAHPPIIEKVFLLPFRNIYRSKRNTSLRLNQLLSFIRFQEKFSANAVAKIIAEKQRRPVSSGSVLHTTQKGKSTVLQQSKFLKIR